MIEEVKNWGTGCQPVIGWPSEHLCLKALPPKTENRNPETVFLSLDKRPDFYEKIRMSGNNSAVECDLAKVEVAGSNPVSRSRGGIAKR